MSQARASQRTKRRTTPARFFSPIRRGLEAIGRNLCKGNIGFRPAHRRRCGSARLRRINQGFIENSNVNIVEELVGMIAAQRAYETNSKVISTADRMLGTINQAIS
ncbi:MAG: flagellar basal body rod C-terminal domain-containing protein [Pyrinomonadaceae bacterium]